MNFLPKLGESKIIVSTRKNLKLSSKEFMTKYLLPGKAI